MATPRGFPVILSSPSGGGKTTVADMLIKELPFLRRSRSTTTRPHRTGEQPGRDYEFVSGAEFERRKSLCEFAEWAVVHGYLYGTSKAFVEETCNGGVCPLLVIDVQGGLAMKRYDPHTVLLFLMPHSLAELEGRLRSRETESREALEMRLNNARQEIAAAVNYDYIIVNEQLNLAVNQVCHVLMSCVKSGG